MFFNSSTSVFMRLQKPPPPPAPPGSNSYYTFDTVDYNSLTHKNQETGLYNLTIQANGMKDSTTNITGTADLNMIDTSANYATISSVSTGISGITIACWFRSNNSANGTRIFDLGNGAANYNIELYLDGSSNKPVFCIYNGVTPFRYTGTSFIDVAMRTDNTYRHIGIVMDPNGTFKYYLNGGLHRTTTGNQYPNAITRTTNYIGRGSNALTTYLNGGIGEFRMYHGMKTDADMLSYYKSNTRIDNYSNMFCHYKFLSGDLTGNGTSPKIRNWATTLGTNELTFNRTTLILTNQGASNTVGLASEYSKFGGEYFYSYCTTPDATFGANLPAITSLSDGGMTICFWFKLISTPIYWAVLFGMNTQGGTSGAAQTRRISVAVNTTYGGNPMVVGTNNNSASIFPSATTNPTTLGSTTWLFYSIRTDATAQTVGHYIDMDISMSLTGQETSNLTYTFSKLLCAPALDVPAYAQMDDFRFYNKKLTDSELRAIYTKTNKL